MSDAQGKAPERIRLIRSVFSEYKKLWMQDAGGGDPRAVEFVRADTVSSAQSLLTRFAEGDYERCPNCPDQGWYADDPTDDPEQVQCEFCECEPRSLFKLKGAARAAIAQAGAHKEPRG